MNITAIPTHIRFMSTGFVVSNVWSMSRDLRNASMDESLNARDIDDPTFRVFLTSADDPSKRQIFTCDLCGKEYTWMCSLRRHQLQCGNKEARNKCEFCSKKFYRRDRLKEHLLTYHYSLAFDCETWLTKILGEKKWNWSELKIVNLDFTLICDTLYFLCSTFLVDCDMREVTFFLRAFLKVNLFLHTFLYIWLSTTIKLDDRVLISQ